MTGDPEQEYFSDGLTEDIINALSHWKEFPVIARSSSFTYKGKAVDVRQVSRDLGARYVLEGSVRKAGERLRVTAELLDADTGHHVWADRLDRRIDDIFAVQDEIAQQIASIVEPAITKAEIQRLPSVRITKLSAWDLYQRGNFYHNRFTPEAAGKAREFFTRAAQVDPTYAPAFAGIARSWNIRIMLGRAIDHKAAIEASFKAARQAVAADDSDSFAHMTLGLAHMWLGDHDRAVAEVTRSVQCNPSNSAAHIVCGNVLDVAGRPEEGIVELQAGIRLNPLNPGMHQSMTWLAGAYLNARRYGEALASLENTLLHDVSYPLTHVFNAITLAYLGKTDRAKAALSTCEQVNPGFIQKFASWRPYRLPEDNDHIIEGLRKAGWQG
jgi:adenylate cyclase